MRRRIPILIIATALAGCGAVPDGRNSERPTASSARTGPAISRPADNRCLAELGAAGSRFAPLPDQYYGAGCQTVGSVKLSAISGDAGEFALSNIGPVACPLASDLAAWARFGVDRAARQILGSPLARIETMGSYSCRNVAGSSRRSAHSRAEAIDVSAFVLADGRRIALSDSWNGGSRSEREFLRIVHRSACKRFGTVLGPDYNSAHEDHFHLEHGGGGFCR